jgi:O-antigen/teichoic acid export membrane protein
MIDILSKVKLIKGTNKQLLINTMAVLGTRGFGLIVSLFTMPAYMRYFEEQKILGLWFTLLAVLTWILTFDLGIGNGLRNKLVKPLIERDTKKIKTYISSAYIISIIIAFIAFVIGYVILPLINWNALFNISIDSISSKSFLNVVLILYLGVLLQFVLKLIYSIFYALQKSAVPNILTLFSSIIILIFVLYSDTGSMEDNLILLAKMHVLFTNFPLVVATIIVFLTELKHFKPSIRFFNFYFAKDVMKLGGVFFLLQITSLLLTSTNEVLITWLSGTEDVVDFQIYNKLFLLVGSIFTLALTPIWSAVTKAFEQNNFKWLRKLYKLLKLVSVLFILGEFLLIFILQFIVDFWLGENTIKINIFYAFMFATFGGLYIWHSTITSIVNGIGKLKIQLIWLSLGAVVNVPVAYILFKFTGSWISIVVANIISLLPYCIIQPFYINKYLKDDRSNENDNI